MLHGWQVVEQSAGSAPSGGGKKGKRPEFEARLEKRWSVAHDNKINAITGSATLTSDSCSEFFVADLSSDVIVYRSAERL